MREPRPPWPSSSNPTGTPRTILLKNGRKPHVLLVGVVPATGGARTDDRASVPRHLDDGGAGSRRVRTRHPVHEGYVMGSTRGSTRGSVMGSVMGSDLDWSPLVRSNRQHRARGRAPSRRRTQGVRGWKSVEDGRLGPQRVESSGEEAGPSAASRSDDPRLVPLTLGLRRSRRPGMWVWPGS